MVSKGEMKTILEGTGWNIKKFIDSNGSNYAAIIEKIKWQSFWDTFIFVYPSHSAS